MPAIAQPFGRMLSILGREYLHLLRVKLNHLDIDRHYYALILIESHEGTITQQELYSMLDSDKVSIVRVVDYLSEKGYIIRMRHPNDRRKQILLLTQKAKQALPEIKNAFRDVNDIALSGLNNSQISELTETIKKIKTNLTANISTL